MKLTTDSETLAENKVLILYVLSIVNKPITNDALYSIVNSAVELNYFYFEQFLLDLVEVKYVICYKKESQTVYEITEEGKKTLDLTLDILPGIIKLKVDTSYKSSMENVNNAESIIADFTPISEKEFKIDCKIVEDNDVIFELKTIAYSSEQAQEIIQNWKNNAKILYPKFLEILSSKSNS